MRHGLFCRQYRNSVWRFEPSPLGGAEKSRRFLTRELPVQKKVTVFGRATLQRRKNPLFLDVQPCGAENPEALLPNNPAAQKILRRYCQTTLRRRKS